MSSSSVVIRAPDSNDKKTTLTAVVPKGGYEWTTDNWGPLVPRLLPQVVKQQMLEHAEERGPRCHRSLRTVPKDAPRERFDNFKPELVDSASQTSKLSYSEKRRQLFRKLRGPPRTDLDD